MELISIVGALAAGVVVGAWGYRYLLKRDPAKLERWAAEVRQARQRVSDGFK